MSRAAGRRVRADAGDGAEIPRRLPAEFEPSAAVWLSWPHLASDWPGKLEAVRWAYVEFVRLLHEEAVVRLLVHDAAVEADARRRLSTIRLDRRRVLFHRVQTDRGWMRDIAPALVETPRGLEAVRWRFNGWARYANHRRDERVAGVLCRDEGWRSIVAAHRGRPVVLEGGAYDVDGEGTLLATRECLLSRRVQVRNPGFTAAVYEEVFRRFLGVRRTIWLPGGIAGDDTHGHVDDVARFAAAGVVVAAAEPDRADENHAPLGENLAVLRRARDARGRRLRVVEVPMPRRIEWRGQRLPASYANFLILNGSVIVPTFDDPNDRIALERIGRATGRRPVGLHAVDLVLGLGTVHCLTHQIPGPPPRQREK